MYFKLLISKVDKHFFPKCIHIEYTGYHKIMLKTMSEQLIFLV